VFRDEEFEGDSDLGVDVEIGAYARRTFACEPDRDEQARRGVEEERAQTECEAADREKARSDSERACLDLEQSGIPDHPVAKLACAAQ
jgi:hypothetical protein